MSLKQVYSFFPTSHQNFKKISLSEGVKHSFVVEKFISRRNNLKRAFSKISQNIKMCALVFSKKGCDKKQKKLFLICKESWDMIKDGRYK